MVTTASYAVGIACPIGVILHAVGFVLFLKLRKSNMDHAQRCIVINLCLAELFANVFLFVSGMLDFLSVVHPLIFFLLLRIFMNAYHLATLLLTFNRFLHTQLNIRYPIYWTKKHTNGSIIALWVISGMLGSAMLYISNIALTLIDVLLDTLIVILPICVYSNALILSRKLRQITNNRRNSFYKGYLISAAIALTNILFTATPHIILAVCKFLNIQIKETVTFILVLTMIIGFWMDALIYVFICPYIRRLLKDSFNRNRSTLRVKNAPLLECIYTGNKHINHLLS